MKILSIGATGSIGRMVVAHALRKGFAVRAFARDEAQARQLLPEGVEILVGDATRIADLSRALREIDAVVLTHSAHGPRAAIEAVDYGVVRDLLQAARGTGVRIALMTSFGVTAPEQQHNQELGILDWKRRSERLLRRSGHDYTIVRPGWFDYNLASERRIVFLQGDPLRSGTAEEGRIARDEIARVLVDSLTLPQANRKTLELVASEGDEQADLAPLFSVLLPDAPGSIDGVLDPDTLPLQREPARVLEDLQDLAHCRSSQPSL